MTRAIGGLFLGFALVFLAIFWVRTCLPNPNEEDIDWLRREDVIVVQMKVLANQEAAIDLTVPAFTLYGDGTVIAANQTANQPATLWKSNLSDGEVEKLLEYFLNREFMDAAYEQPRPDGNIGAITFLYVQTLTAGNAARIEGASFPVPSDSGDEWSTYERMIEVIEHLRAFPIAATGGTFYVPEEVLFIVRETDSRRIDQIPAWPFESILLSEASTQGSDATPLILSGQAAEALNRLTFQSVGGAPIFPVFAEDGRAFEVFSRPILPYEENFPEFEPPSDPVSP